MLSLDNKNQPKNNNRKQYCLVYGNEKRKRQRNPAIESIDTEISTQSASSDNVEFCRQSRRPSVTFKENNNEFKDRVESPKQHRDRRLELLRDDSFMLRQALKTMYSTDGECESEDDDDSCTFE